MNAIMALLAFCVLATFLGILIWKVPSLDLILIAAATAGFAGWDFLSSLRDKTY
ncbi:MAG: hypothetical protein ACFCUS_15000 [Rubrimonas sp.]|uniref:hypothetical protein n=1 Tax=Rubrimonas sp. TaxID=2036015 RepID=UPI002FDE2018